MYDGSGLKDQRILITGAEQGLGFELVKEVVAQGGTAIQAGRTSSTALDEFSAANPGKVEIILGVDVCSDDAMKEMVANLKDPIDILINCAGYFYGPAESVGIGCEGHMNFKHQMLQIDVCAVGPLRVTHAIYKAGKLGRDGKPGKVIIITSQAGSCEWRFTQNPTPKPGEEFHGNYGHHMSRCAPVPCRLPHPASLSLTEHPRRWRVLRLALKHATALTPRNLLQVQSGVQHHGCHPLAGAQGSQRELAALAFCAVRLVRVP